MKQNLRTPIVCVMGHVDHGKTTLLDKIRGTGIAQREAGLITQHIGATEVPLTTIKKVCGNLFKTGDDVPGLLFIDTPGHSAFTTLRARGGALADLAVLIIDINEGFQPQTIEVIDILKRFKTPFVVAANKIDRIHGWNPKPGKPFVLSYPKQAKHVKESLDNKIYKIIEELYNKGFSSDRYDRVADFQKNIGVIPLSAKTGEGIPDLLMVLIGLAKKFLEKHLEYDIHSPGKGTILEVKEERGLGTTLDVILYDGEIKVGDRIVFTSLEGPITTNIKALLRPKPLRDIRAEKKFKHVKSVVAASGIKISAPNIEKALSGSEIRVANNKDLDKVISEIKETLKIFEIKTDSDGILIKADTLGSLEALLHELKNQNIHIRKADIGNITRYDISETKATKDELNSAIIGFNVSVLKDAKEELMNSNIKLILGDVIYKLVEEYIEWADEIKEKEKRKKYEAITRPGKLKILPDCIFRQSNPVIVGVHVLGGTIKKDSYLIKKDGSRVGILKEIQENKEKIDEASVGSEVAVSIYGPVFGRHIKEGDILYIDIPEKDAKILEQDIPSMNPEEKEILTEFMEIKRKDNPFWGK